LSADPELGAELLKCAIETLTAIGKENTLDDQSLRRQFLAELLKDYTIRAASKSVNIYFNTNVPYRIVNVEYSDGYFSGPADVETTSGEYMISWDLKRISPKK